MLAAMKTPPQTGGVMVESSVILELPAEGGPLDRLEGAGLLVNIDEGVAAVDEPFPGTPLFQELKGFDFYADRPVTLDVVLI
jgi:hypothetical protein